MMLDIKRLIYGKNDTENIVNISVKDETVFIYREINGKIQLTKVPFERWVLSPFHSTGAVKLNGKQHFQYIKKYKSEQEFQSIRKKIYEYNLYHVTHKAESFMILNGYTYFKGMKPQDISILSFDIETTGLDANAADAEVKLITNTFRRIVPGHSLKKHIIYKKTFNIEDYETQYDMIRDWCNFVMEENPSILVGHNIVMFDLPYLNKIMNKVGESLMLGRDGSYIEIEDRPRELRKDGSQSYSYHRINCFGREIVDTFFLAIKYDIGRKYESYGLKAIVRQEGLEKKGRTFIDASKIKHEWNDLEKRKLIIQYAEEDSDDSLKLFDLMIPATFYIGQYVPKPLQIMTESATGSQLNAIMVRAYIQDGFAVAKSSEVEQFEGAISIGEPGIFRNCLKVDVASLYPSIMLQYEITDRNKDFNNVLLQILNFLRDERLLNKKKAKETDDRYYDELQNAQKVLINSMYGFMGAGNLNYNYPFGAAEVTRHGREILTTALDWATKINNFKLVNCDTDSIMFCKSDMSTFSDKEQDELIVDLNSNYPETIKFEHDGYYPTVICLKAKNYVLYDGKKIKLKGSGIKDQKKEAALREMLNQLIENLIFEDGCYVAGIYQKYIQEALNPTDIKRWCQKKTLTKSVIQSATDPEARKNERVVWEAIQSKNLQEGDKFYVYPAILHRKLETTELKNGKKKHREILTTGLKTHDDWQNDHDSIKLIERVYDTVLILKNVVDEKLFINYSLKRNQSLLGINPPT